MQFPGDAHPLLVDPPLCLLRGLPGQLRALGVKVGAAAADRQPGEERDREVGRDEEEAAAGLPEGVIGRRGGHQHGRHRDRPRARAQRRRRRIGGERAHRDGGQQQCHAVLVAGQGVGDDAGRRRAQHQPRVAVPPGEDGAGRGDEQQRGVRRVRQMVLAGEVGAGSGRVRLAVGGDHGDHGDHHGDGRVAGRGPPADARARPGATDPAG